MAGAAADDAASADTLLKRLKTVLRSRKPTSQSTAQKWGAAGTHVRAAPHMAAARHGVAKDRRNVSTGSRRSHQGRPYQAIIAHYASEFGVPVSLAHAVITVESNYKASARGRAGEVGLMQIKPATARGIGYRGSVKGLYQPETNIKYGIKYLAKAYRLGGGSTCGAILRYNAGHGAKRMNPISSAYCAKVKRILKSG